MKGNSADKLYSPVLEKHLEMIEGALDEYLPHARSKDDPLNGFQSTVIDAMAYACSAGGKRLRPVLVLEFCRVCGGDIKAALPFACAVEMIHCYSLVHDDLPCMDNSLLRRGRPSAFAAYGEDIALLAGDALLNRAFEVMLNAGLEGKIPANYAMAAAGCLAHASGVYGMIGGQTIDIQSESKAIDIVTLEALQKGKTMALIAAACKMGALLAGAEQDKLESACSFGENLGICFQIVDDILDVTSNNQQLGKPVGGDAEKGKSTYVSLLGLEAAEMLAGNHTAAAMEAAACFGADGAELACLAAAFGARTK